MQRVRVGPLTGLEQGAHTAMDQAADRCSVEGIVVATSCGKPLGTFADLCQDHFNCVTSGPSVYCEPRLPGGSSSTKSSSPLGADFLWQKKRASLSPIGLPSFSDALTSRSEMSYSVRRCSSWPPSKPRSSKRLVTSATVRRRKVERLARSRWIATLTQYRPLGAGDGGRLDHVETHYVPVEVHAAKVSDDAPY